MLLRRVLIIGGILLVLFLAMYSWNRRTRALDDMATNVGLEISSWVMEPLRSFEDLVGNFWTRYFDLVDVRDENLRLKERVDDLEAKLMAMGEDMAELRRLRALVRFPVDVRWRPLAARVLAGRLGPGGTLDSITISRGYANGARPGAPLVTNLGLVGRVLRSSAHAATVLLITDPGSRVAVFGQESRAQGILKGRGIGKPLEVDFVARDSGMLAGEPLVTSGLDNKYPKGLPVARVSSIAPSDYTQFMAVEATPLVDLRHLEEVLLLEKSGVEIEVTPEAPAGEMAGPPLPPEMAKAREEARQKAQRNAQNDLVSTNTPANPATSPSSVQGQTETAHIQETPRQNRPEPDSGRQAPRFRVIEP